jgi:spore maturation protein CgeB
LASALVARGHHVHFLERDVPWYASHRDLTELPGVQIELYPDLGTLRSRHTTSVREADLVIVGSYVPDGVAVGEWVVETAQRLTAFYDIDTPVTLAKLSRGDFEYLSPGLIREYQIYLSFTGGPILRRLEQEFGSPMARPLYCSVDPTKYFPEPLEPLWDLGYLGTYSSDRQPTVERFLLEPARRWGEGRFVVAGPQYPAGIDWPQNVARIDHLPPAEHRHFYNQQRFTLNVTRADMIAAGYSPSVRLFEAAACATPIVSDVWDGLNTFFAPGREILLARNAEEVEQFLRELSPTEARALGEAARARVLAAHTATHRAIEIESHAEERVHLRKSVSAA